MAKLDAIARQRCFERDLRCQRCGAVSFLEWAHVITRRDLSLRWEPDNALALCNWQSNGCHEWFDSHKKESLAWFESKWPDRWEHIQEIRNSHVEIDLKELLVQMRS